MDPLGEANKLLGVLQDVRDVCEKKHHNVEVMRELGFFIQNLKYAIGVLECRTLDRRRARIEDTPNVLSSWTAGTYLAAQRNPVSRLLSCELLEISKQVVARTATLCLPSDELVEDLECAAESLQQVLKVPRNSWNIATLATRVRSVREIVIKSFQSKLQITTFDVMSEVERQQQQQQEFQKNLLQAHRASKAFPNSVRQNFSSIRLEPQGPAGQDLVPDELRCLPRPGVDIVPAQTSRRMESDDDDFLPDVMSVIHNDNVHLSQSPTIHAQDSKMDNSGIRLQTPRISNTETESFFADVLANLEIMRNNNLVAAPAESHRSKHTDEEIAEWFEDPITGEIMVDPIKCTDGRTYDRWTIIDHNLAKCPYDSSMLDFRIAFDDIDMRARLFRVFPEKEVAFRTRRLQHRQKALDHVRKGENREAVAKLNQVLQWNSNDVECKTVRDHVQTLLQPSDPPLPNLTTPAAPASSGARSLGEHFRRCSITSWLWRRRSR